MFSELVLRAELHATRVRRRAPGTARDVRRIVTDGPAAEVLRVEEIVDVQGHAQVCARNLGKILPQADVDALIRPAARDDAVLRRRRESTVQEGGRSAEARRTSSVRGRTAAQRKQATELHSGNVGQVDDPVADNALAFVLS